MIYDIKIPQSHLLALLQLLENVPAPMAQTRPVYDNLKAQLDQQDRDSALVVTPQHQPVASG